MTEQIIIEKKKKEYKLPLEARIYHRTAERKKRGDWKCTRCGAEVRYKDVETKEKLCDNCAAYDIIERKAKKEPVNAMSKVP